MENTQKSVKNYKIVKDKISLIIKESTEIIKKELIDSCKTIFAEHPDLDCFYWTQYTPYFMDGSECIFRVNADEIYVTLKSDLDEKFHLYDLDEINKKLKLDLENFSKLISEIPDEFLRTIFGDHIKVVVYNDRLEVEDYEHE